MKKYTMTRWFALLAFAACGAVAQAADDYAPSDDELMEEGLTELEDPFEVFLGAGARGYSFQHSALQTRSDRDIDGSEDWRDGDIDGEGWGLELAVTRKSSRIVGRLVSSEYTYDLEDGILDHHIETDRRDFDIVWEELSGQSERAQWGWLLGARYISLDERFTVIEGEAELDDNGSVNWFLAQAGYWGNIHPFYRDYMSIYGGARLFIGEAEGIARVGSDAAIDGVIDQTYDESDYSLAYGWNFTVGVAFRIRNVVGLHVDYFRESLYSFDSTDSGIMVFPDNNDALFIDESHGVNAYVSIIW